MKEKSKKIGLILLAVVLAFAEFGLDMYRAKRFSGWAFVVLIALAGFGLYRDIRKVSKQTRGEEIPEDVSDPIGDATVGALSMLDKGLRKLTPDYDPEAERNARNANIAAIAKLDEMKSAGLIDEKEYQKRKKELAGK